MLYKTQRASSPNVLKYCCYDYILNSFCLHYVTFSIDVDSITVTATVSYFMYITQVQIDFVFTCSENGVHTVSG